MTLTPQQIQDIIKMPDPIRKGELGMMSKHDIRCAFHTEPTVDGGSYLGEVFNFVARIIAAEKLQMFKHLCTFPVQTVEFTNGVLDELKKVFEAQDRYVSFEFEPPELSETWEALRKEIGELTWWQTKGFALMKAQVNSYVIIDLPAQQKGKFPSPYFYTICPNEVVDTKHKLDGSLEYIIFKKNGVIYAFDDAAFRTFEDKDLFKMISEVPHDLGYTPANSFWGTDFSTQTQLHKQNPITNSLSKLDNLLIAMICGDHLEWYAGFPVTIGVEHKCTYNDNGVTCEGGLLHYEATDVRDCPECKKANKQLYGPGSFHKAPARASNDDPDYMDSFRFVSPETESISAFHGGLDRKMSWITYNMIGVMDEATSEAINEKQVVSQFESRVNVLTEVAENFQRIQKWTCDTLCRLAYGPAFKGSTVKYGTRFFLYSAAQLREEYEDSKTKGAAMYELISQRKSIIQTEFKQNPYMKQRLLLMSQLEPYPDMMVADMADLGIDKTLIILKAGLDNFVSRFERENSDIVTFMQFSPLDTKINYIRETMLGYVDEDVAEEPVIDPTKPPIPGTPPVVA